MAIRNIYTSRLDVMNAAKEYFRCQALTRVLILQMSGLSTVSGRWDIQIHFFKAESVGQTHMFTVCTQARCTRNGLILNPDCLDKKNIFESRRTHYSLTSQTVWRLKWNGGVGSSSKTTENIAVIFYIQAHSEITENSSHLQINL